MPGRRRVRGAAPAPRVRRRPQARDPTAARDARVHIIRGVVARHRSWRHNGRVLGCRRAVLRSLGRHR